MKRGNRGIVSKFLKRQHQSLARLTALQIKALYPEQAEGHPEPKPDLVKAARIQRIIHMMVDDISRVDSRFAPAVNKSGSVESSGPIPTEISQEQWTKVQEIYESAISGK